MGAKSQDAIRNRSMVVLFLGAVLGFCLASISTWSNSACQELWPTESESTVTAVAKQPPAAAKQPPAVISDCRLADIMQIDDRLRVVHTTSNPPIWMAVLNGDLAQSAGSFKNARFAEPALERILRDALAQHSGTQPATVVDVGANIGGLSLIASSLGAKVVSFEPVSLHREKIAVSVCLNNFRFPPRIIPKGASDKAMTLRIMNYDEATQVREVTYEQCVATNKKSHLRKEHDSDEGNCAETIETITLDDALTAEELQSAVFVKLDIEGHEVRALQGAHKLLDSRKLRFIHFEWAPGLIGQLSPNPGLMFDILKAAGFGCVFEKDYMSWKLGQAQPLSVPGETGEGLKKTVMEMGGHKTNFFCERAVV